MRWWVGKIVAGIAFFIVAAGVFSLVTMLLWNALVPSLFKGPQVTFVQAVGLLLLSHILLRGGSPWRHGHGWRRDQWKKRLEERLQAMTPEERERFREEWRGRCGWAPGPHAPQETGDQGKV